MQLAAKPKPQLNGRSVEDLLQTADRLTRAGKRAEAIAVLERIVQLLPDHCSSHFNLALAYLNVSQPARAAAGFRRAIDLKPNFAKAYHNLGIALARLGQDEAAIVTLTEATKISPGMAEAYDRLGGLLRGRGRLAEAIHAYKRAAATAPNTTLGRLNQARAMKWEGRDIEAEACLRRAISLDRNSGALQWLLAIILIEDGRFDEATTLLRRTIELDPTQVAVYYDFVMSLKLTEADRTLVEHMSELAARSDVVGEQRVRLMFAIAKAHEDLGEYGEAIRYLDEANLLSRRSLTFDRAAHARRTDAIIGAFTAKFLADNVGLGVDDTRPIAILGMPRSGTTLVEQIVSSHPQVAAGGEIHFWAPRGDCLDGTSMAESAAFAAGKLASGYRDELDHISRDAVRVTDKAPYNFFWIGLIHMIFPNARIIHCRRNPLDTCLSIYTKLFGVRTDYASDRGDIVFYYRQYLKLMEHWRATLPSGTILEVQYEDLVAEPEFWSRRLIEFSGLEWDPACLRPEANRRAVRTASVWQVRQPIYRSSVERWRLYEPWLGELRELAPKV